MTDVICFLKKWDVTIEEAQSLTWSSKQSRNYQKKNKKKRVSNLDVLERFNM